MNEREDNWKNFETQIKYFPIYLSIIYSLGFLILSTRLSFLGIYIKDFLTLDYLKAGILFLFIEIPLITINHEIYKGSKWTFKWKNLLRFLLTMLMSLLWFSVLDMVIFERNNEELPFHVVFVYIIISFATYWIYHLGLRAYQGRLKPDIMDIGVLAMFVIITITGFSNLVYPLIQFRFGGGAPYAKTLIIENGLKKEEVIEVDIYYESNEWIHFKQDSTVQSLPRNKILRQINYISK